jgi:hypothetical protein
MTPAHASFPLTASLSRPVDGTAERKPAGLAPVSSSAPLQSFDGSKPASGLQSPGQASPPLPSPFPWRTVTGTDYGHAIRRARLWVNPLTTAIQAERARMRSANPCSPAPAVIKS